MQMLERSSILWNYLPSDIRGLIEDGEKLVEFAQTSGSHGATDFSYIVFPFSKAYEGFLKRFFLDLDIIKEDEYYGDDIRIGRILNPTFMVEKQNIFEKLCSLPEGDKKLAEGLWMAWRHGRNQVFHYFPHNFRRLTFEDAFAIIQELLTAMNTAVEGCKLRVVKPHVETIV